MKIVSINRRMLECNNVLQTQINLFQPEICPKIALFDPFSAPKSWKTFGHSPVKRKPKLSTDPISWSHLYQCSPWVKSVLYLHNEIIYIEVNILFQLCSISWCSVSQERLVPFTVRPFLIYSIRYRLDQVMLFYIFEFLDNLLPLVPCRRGQVNSLFKRLSLTKYIIPWYSYLRYRMLPKLQYSSVYCPISFVLTSLLCHFV